MPETDASVTDEHRRPLPENRARMLSSDLSGTALVSQDVRAWPVAQRAAFEAQIPTEVLRQDQSRSSVHHEGCAGKAALPVPPGWQKCSDGVGRHFAVLRGFLRFRVRPHNAHARVHVTDKEPRAGKAALPVPRRAVYRA